MHFHRSTVLGLVLFLLMFAAASFSLAEDNTMVWEFPGYVLTVHTQPQHSQDKNLMPILLGRPKAGTPPVQEHFGIHFEQDYQVLKDAGTFWVYELFDVNAGRPIKRISLDEVFGITKDTRCEMIADEKSTVEGLPYIRTVYRIREADYRLTLIRQITLIRDPALPTGHRLETTFEVQNKEDRPLNTRFSLRGRADSYAAVHDSASLFILNTTEEVTDLPILVQHIHPVPQRVTVEPKSEQNPNPTYVLTGIPVAVSAGERREVMALSLSGSTVEGPEQARQQAGNLAAFLGGAPGKPDLILTTFADKGDAQAGDMITYTILYHNIGTAPMTEVLITNPIPAAVSYVEGSAGGEDAEIQVSTNHISWRIDRTLRPDEQGTVFFKLLVK